MNYMPDKPHYHPQDNNQITQGGKKKKKKQYRPKQMCSLEVTLTQNETQTT